MREIPPLPRGATVQLYPFNTDVHKLAPGLKSVAFGEAWFLAQAVSDDRGYILAYDGGTAIDSPNQWGANDAVIIWRFDSASDRSEYIPALLRQWFPTIDPAELTRGADIHAAETQEGGER